MFTPWSEVRLTPIDQLVTLLMDLGPLESQAPAALPASLASGQEASELPCT